MVEYELRFKMEIFKPEYATVFIDYFEGRLKAYEAQLKLNWSQATWHRHMSGIFSLAVGDSDLASIREIKETRLIDGKAYTLDQLQVKLKGCPTKHVLAIWDKAKS